MRSTGEIERRHASFFSSVPTTSAATPLFSQPTAVLPGEVSTSISLMEIFNAFRRKRNLINFTAVHTLSFPDEVSDSFYSTVIESKQAGTSEAAARSPGKW